MPYRRLPNTDAARVRALEKAIEKNGKMPLQERAFSQSLHLEAQFFLNTLRKGIIQNRSTHSDSVAKGANFTKIHRKMKMYISHFIQVLNMSIMRGETAVSVRDFYGLSGKKLPKLETEEDLIFWGKKLIDGENERHLAGAGEMANPRIGNLKSIYNTYLIATRNNDLRISHNIQSTEYIDDLRKQGDEKIAKIWDSVEAYFAHLPAEERRAACAEYGIVYVFRKSELNKNTESQNEVSENTNE